MDLEARYTKAVSTWMLPSKIGEKWKELEAAYSDPGRFYHTLTHLKRMFYFLDDNGIHDKKLDVAVFYHDFIYVPMSHNNESESTIEMTLNLEEYAPFTAIQRMEGLVFSTQNHLADPEDYLETYMVDADLIGFSDPAETVKENTEKVWQEYSSVVSREEFLKGQMAFLLRYLGRKPFYYTQPEDVCKRAVCNISGELYRLAQELYEKCLR